MAVTNAKHVRKGSEETPRILFKDRVIINAIDRDPRVLRKVRNFRHKVLEAGIPVRKDKDEAEHVAHTLDEHRDLLEEGHSLAVSEHSLQPEQAHQSGEPPQPKDTSQVENKDALHQLVGKACQEVQYKGGLEVVLEDLVPLENDHVTLLVNVPREKVQNHVGAKEEVNQSIKGLVPVPLLV